MGNKFKRLIMFLIIVLGIGLFANEEKKAPNEIIKDNPDREVTTVESMKVRDHATMSLSVTKVNKPELKGVLENGMLQITLPKKETKAKIDNRMRQAEVKKVIKVEKITDAPKVMKVASFTAEPVLPNRPTQEQMDNLTPEQIREMLANPPKPEEVVTSGESKELRASEAGENIYVNVFDVDKNEKLVLKVEENGVVVEEYPVAITSVDRQVTTKTVTLTGNWTDKVIRFNDSAVELMESGKSKSTEKANERSNVRYVNLKKVNLNKLVFNDDFFPNEPREIKIDAGSANTQGRVGVAFKLKHIPVTEPGWNLDKSKHFPTVGYKVATTTGETYYDLKSEPSKGNVKSYSNYINSNFYTVNRKKDNSLTKDFNKLEVFERDNKDDLLFTHLTGAITDVSFYASANITSEGSYPGYYKTGSGDQIVADYETENNGTFIQAIAEDLYVDAGESAGTISNNQFILSDAESVKVSKRIAEKPDSNKWYTIENNLDLARLSFMSKSGKDGLGLFINRPGHGIKWVMRYDETSNTTGNFYTITSVQNGKTQEFKVRVFQDDGAWATVQVQPVNIENPSDIITELPKIEFTLIQGRLIDPQIAGVNTNTDKRVEYRKVKYSVEFHRVSNELGSMKTKIDKRLDQYFQNRDLFYSLNGKAINAQGNQVADLSKFITTDPEISNGNLSINTIDGVGKKISDKQTMLYLVNGTIGSYTNYLGLVLAKKGGTVSGLVTNENFAMKKSEFKNTLKLTFNTKNSVEIFTETMDISNDGYFNYYDGYQGNGGVVDLTGKPINNWYGLVVNGSTTSTNDIKVAVSGHKPNFNSLVGKTNIATHYKVTTLNKNSSDYIEFGGTNNGINLPGVPGYKIKFLQAAPDKPIEIQKVEDKNVLSVNVKIEYYTKVAQDIYIKLGEFDFVLNNKGEGIIPENIGSVTTEFDSRFKQFYGESSEFFVTLSGYIAPTFDDIAKNQNLTLRDKFVKTTGNIKDGYAIYQYDAYVNYNGKKYDNESYMYKDEYYKFINSGVFMATSIFEGSDIYPVNDDYNKPTATLDSGSLHSGRYFARSSKTSGETQVAFLYWQKKIPDSYIRDNQYASFTHNLKEVTIGNNFTWDRGYIGSGTVDFTGKSNGTYTLVENNNSNQPIITDKEGWFPKLTGIVTGQTDQLLATHFRVSFDGDNNRTLYKLGAFDYTGTGYAITLANNGVNAEIKVQKNTVATVDKEFKIEYYRQIDGRNIKLGEFTLRIKNTKPTVKLGDIVTKLDARVGQKASFNKDSAFWITLDGSIFPALLNPNNNKLNYNKFIRNDGDLDPNTTISELLNASKDNIVYIKESSQVNGYTKYSIDGNSGNDTLGVKTGQNTSNLKTSMNLARKYFDPGKFEITFKNTNDNYSFTHDLQIIEGINNFDRERGYIGSGSVSFDKKEIGEYVLIKPTTTTKASGEISLSTLNGWLPVFSSTVKNDIVANWYEITVKKGNETINKSTNINSKLEIDNDYSITLTKNDNTTESNKAGDNKYIKIHKKRDTTTSMEIFIEYYTAQNGIKLGEFTLNLSNKENLTELGRIITEIDPRFKQITNSNNYWIYSNNKVSDRLSNIDGADFSEMIESTIFLNNDANITEAIEVKENGVGLTATEESDYKIYGDKYGLKTRGTITTTTLNDAVVTKYIDDNRTTLVPRFKDNTTPDDPKVYYFTHEVMPTVVGGVDFATEGYQESQEVSISVWLVGNTYTLTHEMNNVAGRKINVNTLPNLNGVISGKINTVIADKYKIGNNIYDIGSEATILDGKVRLKLLSSGEIELVKVNDDTFAQTEIPIEYYKTLPTGMSATNSEGIKLGTYTLRLSNSTNVDNMGTITTKIDPRLVGQQTSGFSSTKWIDIYNRIGDTLPNLSTDLSGLISTTRDLTNSRALTEVLDMRESNNVYKLSDRDSENHYSLYKTGTSNPDYAIRLGSTFATLNAIDTKDPKLFAVKYGSDRKEFNVIFRAGDSNKGRYTHIIEEAQKPTSNFTSIDGYKGSGTVDFSGRANTTYKLVTSNAGGTNLVVTNHIGYLPTIEPLVDQNKNVASSKNIKITNYKITVTKDGTTTQEEAVGNGINILSNKYTVNLSSTGELTIEKIDDTPISETPIKIEYFYKNGNINVKLGEYDLTLKNEEVENSVGTLEMSIDPRLTQKDNYWLGRDGKVYSILSNPLTSMNFTKLINSTDTIDREMNIEKIDTVIIAGITENTSTNEGNYAVYDDKIAIKINESIKGNNTVFRKASSSEEIKIRFTNGTTIYTLGSHIHLIDTQHLTDFTSKGGYTGSGTVNLTGKALDTMYTLVDTTPTANSNQIQLTGTHGHLPNTKSLINTNENIVTHYSVDNGTNLTEINSSEGISITNNGTELYKLKLLEDGTLQLEKLSNETVTAKQVTLVYYYKPTDAQRDEDKIKLGSYTLTINNTNEIHVDMGTVTVNIDRRLAQVSPTHHNWIRLNGNLGKLAESDAENNIGNYNNFVNVTEQFNNIVPEDEVTRVAEINGAGITRYKDKYVISTRTGAFEAGVPFNENSPNNMRIYSGDISSSDELVVSKYLANHNDHTGDNTFILKATRSLDNGTNVNVTYNGNLKENYTTRFKENSVRVTEEERKGYSGSGKLNLVAASINQVYSFAIPDSTPGVRTTTSIISSPSDLTLDVNGTAVDARGIFDKNKDKSIANKLKVEVNGDTQIVKGNLGSELNITILNGILKIGINAKGMLTVEKLKSDNFNDTTINIAYYYDVNNGENISDYAIELGTFALSVTNPKENLPDRTIKIDKRVLGSAYKWITLAGKGKETLDATTEIDFNPFIKVDGDYITDGDVKKILGMEGRNPVTSSTNNSYQEYESTTIGSGALPIPTNGNELLSSYKNKMVINTENPEGATADNKFSIVVNKDGDDKIYSGNIIEDISIGEVYRGSGEVLFLDENINQTYNFAVDYNDSEVSATAADGSILKIRNIQDSLPNGKSLTEITGETPIKVANRIEVVKKGESTGILNNTPTQTKDDITFSINSQGGLSLQKTTETEIQADTIYTINFYFEDVLLSTFDLTVKASAIDIGEIDVIIDNRILQITPSWISLNGMVKKRPELTDENYKGKDYSDFVELEEGNSEFDINKTEYQGTDRILRVVSANGLRNGTDNGIYSFFASDTKETAIPYKNLKMEDFVKTTGEESKLVFSKWSQDTDVHDKNNKFVLEVERIEDANIQKYVYKGNVLERYRTGRVSVGEGTLNITAAYLNEIHTFAKNNDGKEEKKVTSTTTGASKQTVDLIITDGITPNTASYFNNAKNIANKIKLQVDSTSAEVFEVTDGILEGTVLDGAIKIGVDSKGAMTITKLKDINIENKNIAIWYYYDPNSGNSITPGESILLSDFTITLTNSVEDLGEIEVEIDNRIVGHEKYFWLFKNGTAGDTLNNPTTNRVDMSNFFEYHEKYLRAKSTTIDKGNLDITKIRGIEGRETIENEGSYKIYKVAAGQLEDKAAILSQGTVQAALDGAVVSTINAANSPNLDNKISILATENSGTNPQSHNITYNLKEIIIPIPSATGGGYYSGFGRVDIKNMNKGTKYTFPTTATNKELGANESDDVKLTQVIDPVNGKAIIKSKENTNIANKIRVSYTTINGTSKTQDGGLSVELPEGLTIGITNTNTVQNSVGGLQLTKTKDYISISRAVIEYYYSPNPSGTISDDTDIKLGEFTLDIENTEFEIIGDNILDFGILIKGQPNTASHTYKIKNEKGKNIKFSVNSTAQMTLKEKNGNPVYKPTREQTIDITGIGVSGNRKDSFFITATANPRPDNEAGTYEGSIEVVVDILD